MSAGEWGWCAAVVVALVWAGREIERDREVRSLLRREPERDTDGADWVQP